MEVNGCQRTPWREELDGKELHGALGDECGFLDIVDLESTHLSTSTTQVWYHANFKGVV